MLVEGEKVVVLGALVEEEGGVEEFADGLVELVGLVAGGEAVGF